MDTWDGLKLCSVCGDCYTLSDMCTSCAQQHAIDNDPMDWLPVVAKHTCQHCGAGIDSVDIECPNCGWDLPLG